MNKNHLIYLLEYIAYKRIRPDNTHLLAWMEINKKGFYGYQKTDISYIMKELGLGAYKKELDIGRIPKDYVLKVKVGNRYINTDIFNEVISYVKIEEFRIKLKELYERL